MTRAGGENDQPVASFALIGKDSSQRELTLLAEQVVQKGFERVNGVGRVDLGGNVTRQIQVRVDPAKLTAFGLSVDQVVQALRTANVSVPVGHDPQRDQRVDHPRRRAPDDAGAVSAASSSRARAACRSC